MLAKALFVLFVAVFYVGFDWAYNSFEAQRSMVIFATMTSLAIATMKSCKCGDAKEQSHD